MSRYFFVLALLVPCSAFARPEVRTVGRGMAPAPRRLPAPRQAPGAASLPAGAARQPPAGSGPVIRTTEIQFHPVNESIIEPQTYLYYIQTQFSRPSEGVLVPFNEETEKIAARRFQAALGHQLPRQPPDRARRAVPQRRHRQARHLPHGRAAAGEDRRLHRVDKVDRTKIDEKMKERGISLRLDSFLDQAVVRRVEGIVKSLWPRRATSLPRSSRRSRRCPAGPSWSRSCSTSRKAPRSRSATSTSSATTRSATARSGAR